MKADVKYFGRVHEYVTYTSTVTLSTPVDVDDVVKARAIAESALVDDFPGCIIKSDAKVHSTLTFQYSVIQVIAEATVPECSNCGCIGHLAKDCSI